MVTQFCEKKSNSSKIVYLLQLFNCCIMNFLKIYIYLYMNIQLCVYEYNIYIYVYRFVYIYVNMYLYIYKYILYIYTCGTSKVKQKIQLCRNLSYVSTFLQIFGYFERSEFPLAFSRKFISLYYTNEKLVTLGKVYIYIYIYEYTHS